jgi:sugar-specific transcriptional regulator TrmB
MPQESNEVAATLIDLGLTAAQARIILALQQCKSLTVKDIAKRTGMFRQEVYTVLSEMLGNGIVEKRLGVPNQYTTLPLNQTLMILLQRKTNSLSDLQKRTLNLVKISNRLSNVDPLTAEEYDFTMITGIERFSTALHQWHRNALRIDSVLILDRFSYEIAERLEINTFRHKRVAKIRTLTCADPSSLKLNPTASGTKREVKCVSFQIPVDIAIFDGKRAHMAIFSNRESALQTKVSALTSNHPYFVNMLQNYFDLLWGFGKRYELQKDGTVRSEEIC